MKSSLVCAYSTFMEQLFGANGGSKAPAKPGYDKFRKDTQIAHFLRFCKGGTKGNLAKK